MNPFAHSFIHLIFPSFIQLALTEYLFGASSCSGIQDIKLSQTSSLSSRDCDSCAQQGGGVSILSAASRSQGQETGPHLGSVRSPESGVCLLSRNEVKVTKAYRSVLLNFVVTRSLEHGSTSWVVFLMISIMIDPLSGTRAL